MNLELIDNRSFLRLEKHETEAITAFLKQEKKQDLSIKLKTDSYILTLSVNWELGAATEDGCYVKLEDIEGFVFEEVIWGWNKVNCIPRNGYIWFY